MAKHVTKLLLVSLAICLSCPISFLARPRFDANTILHQEEFEKTQEFQNLKKIVLESLRQDGEFAKMTEQEKIHAIAAMVTIAQLQSLHIQKLKSQATHLNNENEWLQQQLIQAHKNSKD